MKQLKMKQGIKEQIGEFFSILLGTLDTSTKGNILTGQGVN